MLTKERIKYIREVFDLSEQDYHKILKYQDNKCYICQREFSDKRVPNIDHSHQTGKIRGLLCAQCNRGLGKAEDRRWQWTADCFTRAGMYLSSYPAETALGRIIQSFAGKIGTDRFKKWLKKRRQNVNDTSND